MLELVLITMDVIAVLKSFWAQIKEGARQLGIFTSGSSFDFFSSRITLLVVFVGLLLRLLVAFRGHNFDFDSFVIVVKNLDQGLNVYASTTRYNYGPVWFILLRFLYIIAGRDLMIFRFVLTTFLSLVDVSIFYVLLKRFGTRAACLFFLNPVSILITGYHSQFDNLAIFLGMLSVLLFGNHFEQPVRGKKFLALLVLGISLMTKHLLFVFPLWLAIKQKGFFQKLLVALIPVLIFLLSFIPFLREGADGILQNVFLYDSWNNEYFYRLFVPALVREWLTSTMIWLILLVSFAVFFRKRAGFEALLLYTCILVGTSPAITNQYLAIAIPYISVYPNPFFLLYTLIATWHLAVDFDGLQMALGQTHISKDVFYLSLIALLCLGFVWNLSRAKLYSMLQSVLHRWKSRATQPP